MRVGYHAHGFDFEKIDGKFAWDILFSNTGRRVVMQMDVGNCLGGGGDPIATLKKFPGRATTIHLKEHGEKTFDSDYFKQVYKLCEGRPRSRWYIVEMGDSGGNGLEVPRKSLEKLQSVGK
jgi:sugar phosphate isomerase/epimerase